MSNFAHPEFLYTVPMVLAVLLFVYLKSTKEVQRRLDMLVASKLKPQLIPSFSRSKQILKFCFFTGGIIFILISWSGPQWGTTKRTISPRGIDLLIAIDLSKSMLARDVTPNRLERVKLSLANLLPKVKGDRLGLIGFSGSSFLQCPLTLDHQAFAKSLEELEVGLIPRAGTNLAHPIREAARSFSKDDTDKFLILISDGEDLEGQGLSEAKKAAKNGIRIFTIGIGSKEGSFIPTDPIGQTPKNFLTDREGDKVITKFDEQALQGIALATGGQFLLIGPTGEGISHVFSELKTFGQKKWHEQLSTSLPINRYQVFILLGLIFLMLESLTPESKKLVKTHAPLFLLFLIFFSGCWKPENIKFAEEAVTNGDHLRAADLYSKEITNLEEEKELGRLSFNAGIAYFHAGKIELAEEKLQQALTSSTDEPQIQSKTLNALGNIYYLKANSFLDRQDVKNARNAWEKSREFYLAALSINKNALAEENLSSLNQQIQDRIESLLCKFQGVVWHDINGDGKPDSNEPALKSIVFWDRNDDGEYNKSSEPAIPTDGKGQFAFEWITGVYPTSFHIASSITERNQSSETILLPLFPLPPPPRDASQVKNLTLDIEKPNDYTVLLPWRAAPVLKGKVWNDQDANAEIDPGETGTNSATIFIDSNGNLLLDENETYFKPSEDGSFAKVVPPGQYTVCISPDNKEANVTRPIEEHKSYFTWVDFEQNSDPLYFGVLQDGNQSNSPPSNSTQSEQTSAPEPEENGATPEKPKVQNSEEVNALYERLLQETESKSEPLQLEPIFQSNTNSGRDY